MGLSLGVGVTAGIRRDPSCAWYVIWLHPSVALCTLATHRRGLTKSGGHSFDASCCVQRYAHTAQRSYLPMRKLLHAQPDFTLCSSYFSGVENIMVAMSSASGVPAIKRWGVLVTNLGATVVTVLGALYVLILVSLSSCCEPFEFFHPVASM